MKILINRTHPDNPGGVAHFYRVLQPHLSPDVDYLTIGKRPDESGVVRRSIRMLRDYIEFVRRLRNSNYTLVHLNPSLVPLSLIRDSIFALIAKLYRKKLIVFFRGWDISVETKVRGWWRPLVSIGLFRADAIIVLASEFESALREMGYSGPISRNSTVVADEIFTIYADRVDAEKSGLRMLYLGRVEQNKGIFEAIAAFELYLKNGNEGVLEIAGDGGALQDAREFVDQRSIPSVNFLGYVRGAEKRKALLEADVLLAPYYGEGMPNALLEAMAAGLIIVCRPVGGLKDFFEDDVMGFCTLSKDPTEFAEFLGRIATDPEMRDRISQHNAHFARQHFAAEQVAERLMGVYQSVSATVTG